MTTLHHVTMGISDCLVVLDTPIFFGYGRPRFAMMVMKSSFDFVSRKLCCFSSPTVLLVRPASM